MLSKVVVPQQQLFKIGFEDNELPKLQWTNEQTKRLNDPADVIYHIMENLGEVPLYVIFFMFSFFFFFFQAAKSYVDKFYVQTVSYGYVISLFFHLFTIPKGTGTTRIPHHIFARCRKFHHRYGNFRLFEKRFQNIHEATSGVNP